MTLDSKISSHYTHGTLLEVIEQSLVKLGKDRSTVTLEDLAPVDEFHIGGREASMHFLDQLDLSKAQHVLDIGCGLGGPARFTAATYDTQVTGIDITQEYIETGQELCAWLGLEDRVQLACENALGMGFDAGVFDSAYLMHVGMNIEDKKTLFEEVFRVLKPGARFGVYDIMTKSTGDLVYPVPWAGDASTSWLETPDIYLEAIRSVGFEFLNQTDRGAFALDFFANMQARNKAVGKPPPLSLHTLMGDSAPLKLGNMVANMKAGLIAPCEIIVCKPG